MKAKQIFFTCVVLAVALSRCVLAGKQPNIIFILADDQRSDVLGCYGNGLIQTPTIDRLAAEGVRFENFFCQVPICAASRAGILSGLTQRTHGYNFGEPAVDRKYISTSYPMVLKAAGYRTGFAGKYGVKFEGGGLKEAFDFFREIDRNPYLKKMPDGSLRHETDLCADAAIEFIKSNPAGQPFCMSVSFNASHAEDEDRRPGYHFQWPASAGGLYEGIEMPPPKLADEKYFDALPPFIRDEAGLSRKRFFWRWDTPEKYQVSLRAYYRMITGIDNALARILDELKAQGLDKNTVIVYSADNGMMLGDRGLAGKWNHYDQSLNVPFIVYDPRLPESKRGRVLTEPATLLSVAPTIVDWADLPQPEVYQGPSLAGLIEGDSAASWQSEVYCEHMFNRYNDWRCIRTGKYKYAVYYDEPGGPYECLYDLERDPAEFVNLVSDPEYASVLAGMKKRLEAKTASLPEADNE